MSSTAREVIERESKYLREQEDAAFFLELERYAKALLNNQQIGEVLGELKAETDRALRRFVDVESSLLDEAKAIRGELAVRAPEIDNSDLERPDDPRNPRWMEYELDSFAGFDEVAAPAITAESIGYPLVAEDEVNPGPVSRLLGILRGRYNAAVFGGDAAPGDGPPIRDDLDDLGQRIGNLGSAHDHALKQHRQDVRTLPGLGFGRLVYFGTDLNPKPNPITTDEDLIKRAEEVFREIGQPKTLVRQFVDGERLSEAERRAVARVETSLKAEADRLHQELARRLPAERSSLMRHPLFVGITSAVVGTLVGVIATLVLASSLGDGDPSPTTTVTVTTTSP